MFDLCWGLRFLEHWFFYFRKSTVYGPRDTLIPRAVPGGDNSSPRSRDDGTHAPPKRRSINRPARFHSPALDRVSRVTQARNRAAHAKTQRVHNRDGNERTETPVTCTCIHCSNSSTGILAGFASSGSRQGSASSTPSTAPQSPIRHFFCTLAAPTAQATSAARGYFRWRLLRLAVEF